MSGLQRAKARKLHALKSRYVPLGDGAVKRNFIRENTMADTVAGMFDYEDANAVAWAEVTSAELWLKLVERRNGAVTAWDVYSAAITR
jgi:hypothetical protein